MNPFSKVNISYMGSTYIYSFYKGHFTSPYLAIHRADNNKNIFINIGIIKEEFDKYTVDYPPCDKQYVHYVYLQSMGTRIVNLLAYK